MSDIDCDFVTHMEPFEVVVIQDFIATCVWPNVFMYLAYSVMVKRAAHFAIVIQHGLAPFQFGCVKS